MTYVVRSLFILTLTLSTSLVGFAAEPLRVHTFERLHLTDQFYCEGASFADFNGDGNTDIVSGPYWYAGPDFTDRHEFRPAKAYPPKGYSDNFLTYAYDINNDGHPDILAIGFPGKETYWYENPKGAEGHWPQHLAHAVVDNESPTVKDLTGDGKPELVFHTDGHLGYASPDPAAPTKPWRFVAISPKGDYQRFTHGIGVGDVNNDGLPDLLEKTAWWQNPGPDSEAEVWTRHEVPFSGPGGSQMFAYDFDGDGDNDVITSKAAHAYGLSWFENVTEGDKITFIEHQIMGDKPEQNPYGLVFSQLHAMELVDIDRDGIKDLITGKRYWAHNGNDPGASDPAVSYWFKTVRENGTARFVPHRIDNNSGVGTQVSVGDVSGDKWPDIIVGNKKGTFVLIQHAKEVDQKAWQAAQPKPVEAKPAKPADDTTGQLPVGSDGRPLNLDFETGTLKDWTAGGKAFADQPIRGDTVHPRRGDSKSNHQGDFWIGGFEKHADGPMGSLTSASFRITHPWASFLIGGGSHRSTSLEIVLKSSGEIIHSAAGHNHENLERQVVDLNNYQDKEIFLRLIDKESGGWGHVNFDNFRFHKNKSGPAAPSLDQAHKSSLLHAGLTAEAAAKAMEVPEDFSVQVYAAEPDVKQPIAMAIDDRGRIWVAEAYEYPRRAPEGEGRDRIIIFEDTNQDGKFDKRKVFAEGLNLVSGMEVGFGGVWVGASPYLLFIPDRDGDDVPDAEPQILLDGWHYEDTHETLNAFIWGPDGWLYGCHGVFTHSVVGKPGTLEDQRTKVNAGVWRYHPTRHEFEVFAHGTSNPWGVDFNDQGQMFISACVIPHLYHMIQGGRYQRQGGTHFNPYTYDDIQTIADHAHYAGNIRDHAWWGRNTPAAHNSTDAAGGGHAHSGAMIYLGGNWPAEYRNTLFMNNIHGARLNRDILNPPGSGYIGSHGPDFLLARDQASQIINMRYGPDGQVYMIDWYDMQQCHRHDISAHDRSNGRIYRIAYKNTPPVAVDLKKLSDVALVKHQLNENDWYVRHSRRILQERAQERELEEDAIADLIDIATDSDETRRLRALWVLHVTNNLSPDLIGYILTDESPYVRAWIIQLALEQAEAKPSKEAINKATELAKNDPSPIVRLYLASATQRLPLNDRWNLIAALSSHTEDADDHNLPHLIWYALEPLAEQDPARMLTLAQSAKTPNLFSHTVRRITDIGSEEAIALLVDQLTKVTSTQGQTTFLDAMAESLKGVRSLTMPTAWTSLYGQLAKSPDTHIRIQARQLAVKFGDTRALDETRAILANAKTNTGERKSALQSLLGAKDAQLAPVLQTLIANKSLRREALRGLAAYQSKNTPSLILDKYAKFNGDEKRDAINTLASRPQYAIALLKAVGEGHVPPIDFSADVLRQLRNLKNEEITTKMGDIWGVVRDTAADKKKQIAQYTKMIKAKGPDPDVHFGRAIFAKTCQQCHKLFGTGETIGPELTGSNRADLKYLLTNVIDPSAVMAKEYQPTVVLTDDGRTLTGIVKKQDDRSVTIVTANETLVIPTDEIEEMQLSQVSMMPDNQWLQMKPHEIRSLVAYLASPKQVSALANKENASNFFNGQDLTGWSGNTDYWKVENGEIVGTSPGLKKNHFLVSDLVVADFEFSLKVKLTPNNANSGIQFRSEAQPSGDVKGYQADIGKGWWGKLYEEHGRAILWDKSDQKHVKVGEWNDYRIVAQGHKIRTYLNGNLCVDLDDPDGALSGIIALQIHSGPAMEVRFKDLKLTPK